MPRQIINEDSIYGVDSLLVAEKFGKHRNTMWDAKKRYTEGKKSMWKFYCMSYQWTLLCERAEETNKEEHF